LAAAFARVQAIPWETLGDGPDDPRIVDLMSEFIAGVCAWAAYLQTGQSHVFDNLAAYVNPDGELPDEMDKWLEALYESGRIPIGRGRHYVIFGLRGYLCWSALREANELPEAPLPDPYEPLIQFLERGGGLYVEHHYMMTVYPGDVGMMLTVGDASPVHSTSEEAAEDDDDEGPDEQVIRSTSRPEVEEQCRHWQAKGWEVGEIKEIAIATRSGSEEIVTRDFAVIVRRPY
jgi:hypothetical protein